MLLTPKHLKLEKIERFNQQQGKCKLCNRDLDPDIQRNHLDHDHSLEGPEAGKVRGLLCSFCNVLEGQIKHKFNSSGLNSRNVCIKSWFANYIDYLNQDISKNNLHPQYVPDKVKKFSRMNKDEMLEELAAIGVVIEDKATKQNLVELYRKELRKYLKS